MTSNKILIEDIEELERRFLINAVRAQQNLHKIMGTVTYGELQSFEIARHHGVTAEQFAALPSRADRMKWIEERNARIYGEPKASGFFGDKN